MKSFLLTYFLQAWRMKRSGFAMEAPQRLAGDFSQWKKLAAPGTSSVDVRMPWMTFSSIRFLEKHLDRSMEIFEYGCGGSTLFLCERAGKVISVEHDKEWFHLLGNRIKDLGLANWEGKLIEPEFAGIKTQSIADPGEYGTDDIPLSQHRFRRYAAAIDDYRNEEFDWVLVDGRARPSCIRHAIPKVKAGGYLLLDNSDRKYYSELLPENFGRQFRVVCNAAGPAPFMTEFSMTTIWQKQS
jgi:hypothetical protein